MKYSLLFHTMHSSSTQKQLMLLNRRYTNETCLKYRNCMVLYMVTACYGMVDKNKIEHIQVAFKLTLAL